MIIYNYFRFFNKQLNIKDYLLILINYFLISLITILDILFIALVFLLLNINYNFGNSFFINNINNVLNNISLKFQLSFIQSEVLILLLTLFIKNFFLIFQNFFYFNFIFKLVRKKSAEVFRNYLNLDYKSFIKKNNSYYVKNVSREVDNVFLGIFSSLIVIVGDIFYILFIILFSFSLISVPFYSIHLLLLTLMLLVLSYLWRKLSYWGKIRSEAEESLYSNITDSFKSFKEIKIYNKDNIFVKMFDNFSKKYYKSKIINGVVSVSPKIIIELGVFTFFFISFFQSNQSINEYIPSIAVLALAAIRVLPQISKISSSLGIIFFYNQSFDMIERNYLSKNNFSKQRKLRVVTVNKILLKNISLNFIKDGKVQRIFHKLNILFQKGKIYGVYGSSGVGKSTLLSIISGLLKPDKGSVYFNNQKINVHNVHKIFSMGSVLQNPTMFDESMMFNITLDFNYQEDDIKNVKFLLNKFNLHKFTKQNFLLKKIESSDNKISGGEKQRLSFIRSIYQNPSVLILDEPTSALDKKNEKILFEFLKNECKDKIIIIASHNKKHFKYFDKVINL
jgi:ABC-type bacteriocin/lantibiotic exporter with double-glycine peptidase domain